MVKIATPISDLYKDPEAREKIISMSDCLECRDRNPDALEDAAPKQYLFHSEKDIIHSWDEKEKKFLKYIIKLKKELKIMSFHVSSSCSKPVVKNNVFYFGGREYTVKEMLDNARINIAWLKEFIGKKVIEIAVENNNYYPTPAYRHITEPDFICKLIRENDIFFVFDMAHARVTAANTGILYDKYLEKLPLDRMIQIHVSKESLNNKGWSFDAHEIPDESIFQETKELVEKYLPKYLTIEYYNSKDGLINILEKYHALFPKLKEKMV